MKILTIKLITLLMLSLIVSCSKKEEAATSIDTAVALNNSEWRLSETAPSLTGNCDLKNTDNNTIKFNSSTNLQMTSPVGNCRSQLYAILVTRGGSLLDPRNITYNIINSKEINFQSSGLTIFRVLILSIDNSTLVLQYISGAGVLVKETYTKVS